MTYCDRPPRASKPLQAGKSWLCAAAGALTILAVICPQARGEVHRRMTASLSPIYYVLDSDYFDLKDAPGIELSFRYEILMDIYAENSIGTFRSKSNDTSVTGVNYQFGLLAYFPVFIPYRPYGRLGLGFMSVNPVTATPQETFRPSQTTIYFVAGAGVNYPIRNNIFVEAGIEAWMTPYKYRMYSFDRQHVNTVEAQFTHAIFSLGVSLVF